MTLRLARDQHCYLATIDFATKNILTLRPKIDEYSLLLYNQHLILLTKQNIDLSSDILFARPIIDIGINLITIATFLYILNIKNIASQNIVLTSKIMLSIIDFSYLICQKYYLCFKILRSNFKIDYPRIIEWDLAYVTPVIQTPSPNKNQQICSQFGWP